MWESIVLESVVGRMMIITASIANSGWASMSMIIMSPGAKGSQEHLFRALNRYTFGLDVKDLDTWFVQSRWFSFIGPPYGSGYIRGINFDRLVWPFMGHEFRLFELIIVTCALLITSFILLSNWNSSFSLHMAVLWLLVFFLFVSDCVTSLFSSSYLLFISISCWLTFCTSPNNLIFVFVVVLTIPRIAKH